MNYYREKENKNSNSILSATRPEVRNLETRFNEIKVDNKSNNSILSATRPSNIPLKNNEGLKTKLVSKSRILIYDIDGKFYVEHATAYALNLVNTRAVMLDKPKLIELPISIHNRLKEMDNVEIEYKKIIKKPKLKVYVSNSSYFIDKSAAYSLGFVSDEDFLNTQDNYYCIDSGMLESFKEKFDIEFYGLSIEKENSNKNDLSR